MEYFWKQQDDIPAGMGYPMFGTAHILSVAVTILLVIAFIIWFLGRSDRVQRTILKVIPIFMLCLETFKILFLISVGRFSVGYLPLHMCSLGIFVFLFREFLEGARAKEILGEIAFVLILPSAVAALIFPDWTVYYPAFSFMNLYSFLWHGLLVLYPVLLYIRKDISPSIKHIHWPILFLCVVVPPIYVLDKLLGCNYFFVNWPERGTPLEFLSSFMGNPGYLVGYAALVLLIILLIYIFIHFFHVYCHTKK